MRDWTWAGRNPKGGLRGGWRDLRTQVFFVFFFLIHTSGLFYFNKIVKVNHTTPATSLRNFLSSRRQRSSPRRQPLVREKEEVWPRPASAHAPGRGSAPQRRAASESRSGRVCWFPSTCRCSPTLPAAGRPGIAAGLPGERAAGRRLGSGK